MAQNNLKVGVSAEVDGFVQGMDQAAKSAERYEKEVQAVVDSGTSLRKELRQSKNEANDLALAYSKLSKEAQNSKAGQELRAQMEQAAQKTAELRDLTGDLDEKYKNLADDNRWFNTAKDGFDLIANVTLGFVGTLATITGNEEDANRAMAALAATTGLLGTATKIQTALQKQSNIMLAIGTLQSKAKAAADKIAARSLGELTVAQRAFNLVAKANPYVLLGTAALALVGILFGVTNAMKKSEEEIEQIKKEAEETKKVMDEQRNTMVNASSSMMETASRISYLQSAYKSANNEMAKTAILKQAQSEFKKLGLECKSLNDAQTLLIRQGALVLEMIRLQGEAAAVSAFRMEAFKKSFSMLLENGYDIDSASILAGYNATVIALDKRAEKLNQRITQLKSQLPMNENKSTRNTVKTTYSTDSLTALEHKLSNLQSKYKDGLIKLLPDDYKRQVEDLERQIKDKKLELSLELPETMEQKLKNEIARLQTELAFTLEGSVDEAEIKRLISIYQQRLEHEQARLKVVPELEWTEQDEANLDRRINDILSGINPDTYFDTDYDFSGLSDAMKTEADKTVKYMDRIKTAIESFMDIMDDPDASDRAIAKAQKHIDELVPKFDKARQEADEFNKESAKGIKWDKTMDNLKSSIGNVSSAFSSLSQITEDETFNTAGVIAQAIANISLSFADAMKNHKSFTVFDWIAAGTMGLAQLLSMVASIKSAQGYAEGGIINGHSYIGDKLLARVNSKEAILNERQQERALELMDNNVSYVYSQQTVNVVGKIRGKDILIVAENNIKEMNKSGRNISFG